MVPVLRKVDNSGSCSGLYCWYCEVLILFESHQVNSADESLFSLYEHCYVCGYGVQLQER